MPPLPSEMLEALLYRPLGTGYGHFGALVHRHVPFDRLTICAAEGGGGGLRVLHGLAGEDGTSDAVGRLLPFDGSAAGAAYRQQRWLRIDDLEAYRQAHPQEEDARRAQAAGMRSGLLFPLSADERPLGLCLLWSRRAAHFTTEHADFLRTLQPALSAALQSDLAYVEVERRSLELSALERLARQTRSSLDPEQVIPASLDAALGLLGLTSGGLLLRRGDRLELALQRNLSLIGPLSLDLRLPGRWATSPLWRCFWEQQPVLCADLAEEPTLREIFGVPAEAAPGRTRTWLLCIPLVAREERRGVIFACGYGTFPTGRAELERLATIGHWIGSAIDDAERHATAHRLASVSKQQQLESLGALAGGLAHDFNNILATVLLTALHLREAAAAARTDALGPEQLGHDMDVIIAAARRGASMAGQLLAFSRGSPLHLVPLDLNEVVQKAAAEFAGRAPQLHIHTGLRERLPPVRADREQLLRALSNLFQNAAEAMPEGGRLHVETLLREGAAAEGPLPVGTYARIRIADEGPGIDPAVRARLFEPFVTTKRSGAGLGLAMVFGIIKAHGGHIAVDSERPRGAAFQIDLPVPVPDERAAPAREAARAGRVLVVDDEPALLRITARILRGAGYEVDVAHTGSEALARYAQARAYDLVLLDSTMPEMSGREVLEVLLRRDLAVRVLVMSGYSMDSGPAELLAKGARGFLPKPFTPQDLLHNVLITSR